MMTKTTETEKKAASRGDMEEAARAAREALAAEPKVRVLIPLDPQNREADTVELGINGSFYTLRRGESIEVPQSIAALLTRAHYL